MLCKFTKQLIYLKGALASSSRALLWCGMSWGPNAAGGCLTSDFDSFADTKIYVNLLLNKKKQGHFLW